VVTFITRHLGNPIPSPALFNQIGERFRAAVTRFAEAKAGGFRVGMLPADVRGSAAGSAGGVDRSRRRSWRSRVAAGV
jgi:hypothetical protein